jgi:hypothetical protein
MAPGNLSPIVPPSPTHSSASGTTSLAGTPVLASPRVRVDSITRKRTLTSSGLDDSVVVRRPSQAQGSTTPGPSVLGEDGGLGEEGQDGDSNAVLSSEGSGEAEGATLLKLSCPLTLTLGDLLSLIADALRVPYLPSESATVPSLASGAYACVYLCVLCIVS